MGGHDLRHRWLTHLTRILRPSDHDSDDELRQQLEVNLFGVINVTRAALPQMRKQRSGHLVQMSSFNGVEGLVGGGYYAASKFAVEGLSESLVSRA